MDSIAKDFLLICLQVISETFWLDSLFLPFFNLIQIVILVQSFRTYYLVSIFKHPLLFIYHLVSNI